MLFKSSVPTLSFIIAKENPPEGQNQLTINRIHRRLPYGRHQMEYKSVPT